MLVAALLVQVTWAPRLEIAGAFPNLVLLAVIAITWLRGARPGFAAAFAGGVLLDLTAAGPVGPHVLALLVSVYATGLWIRNVDGLNALHASASVAAATILYSLVLVLAGLARGAPSAFEVDVQLAAAAAAYNALLAPFAVAALRQLDSMGRVAEPQ